MSDELLDAPNQQVVRPDGSAPWDEGTGGSTREEETPAAEEQQETDEEGYESWRHVDLLTHAQDIGASPANQGMTKAELIASIEAKEAEG